MSRAGGHEPGDDLGRDRDRPRARRRPGHLPRAGRRAGGVRPARLRDGAICLNAVRTRPAPRAGSTSRRPTPRAPSASTASSSAGPPRTPATPRRPAATRCSTAAGAASRASGRSCRRASRRSGRPTSPPTTSTRSPSGCATRAARSLMEPMDVFDAGRMAFFAHPAGGMFGAWEAGEHTGAQLVNEPVSLAWNTLDHARRRGRGAVPGGDASGCAPRRRTSAAGRTRC